MKKVFSIVCLLLLVIPTVAEAKSSKEVLHEYIALTHSGELEKAYSYLSKNVQEKLSLEDFKENLSFTQDPILVIFLKKTKTIYEDVNENGATSEIKIKQIYPDLDRIIPIAKQVSRQLEDKYNEDKIIEGVNRQIRTELPMATWNPHYTTYKLVKENAEWKVLSTSYKQ